MAVVEYYDYWWNSMFNLADMAPGDTHYWISYPYHRGDVVNLMAYAPSGVPGKPQPQDANSQLRVENVYTSVDANGQYTTVFNVKNVGLTYIETYVIGTSVINK